MSHAPSICFSCYVKKGGSKSLAVVVKDGRRTWIGHWLRWSVCPKTRSSLPLSHLGQVMPETSYHGLKNVQQLTWVLLLKAHHSADCLTPIASAMFGLTTHIWCCLASDQTDFNDNSNNNDIIFVDGRDREPNHQDRVLFCMSPSTLSFCLGFKVATYHKAWHFGAPHLQFQILLCFLVKIQANLDTKILIHTS